MVDPENMLMTAIHFSGCSLQSHPPKIPKQRRWIQPPLFLLPESHREHIIKRTFAIPLRYLLMDAVASRSVSGELKAPTDRKHPPPCLVPSPRERAECLSAFN